MSTDAESLSPEVHAVVGDRLRRTRLQQQMSIRQLADRAGISKTSVVQVESGRGSRRSTYLKVAEVLGLHLDRLMHPKASDERPYAVHRLGDDAWFDLANFGAGPLCAGEPTTKAERAALAQTQGVVPLNILASRLELGRIKPTVMELYSPSERRSHAGEEHVYVLSGRALVAIGDSELELGEGESITFWSAEPHAYAPAKGSSLPVRLLSVRVDT